MNKLMMIVAMLVMAIVMTGCGTIEAKWGGKRVITDADGNPYVVNGQVQTVAEPNEFYSRRIGIDTELGSASMDVHGDGKYALALNSYKSQVSPENAKMIDSVGVLTERAIAAAMTAGVSVITKDSVNAIQAVASQYISAGGTLVPTVTVQKSADGNLTSLTFSDGRVTQTGSVPAAPGPEIPDASRSTNVTVTASAPQS